MNILILGLSSIMKNRIIPALESISTVECVDCASLSKTQENFNSLKARKFYSNYDKALEDSDAEIVYISVRNHEHANLIKKALIYNKHVIVDKPAVTKFEDAEEIFRIASKNNKCVSEAIVYTYHPQLDIIRKIFKDNNEIPCQISVHFTMPGFLIDNFRYKKEFDGGAIFDLGPYAMSLGSEIFDSEPYLCSGLINKQSDIEVETSFNIIMKYSGGRTLNGYFGFETEYMNSVSIFSKDMIVSLNRIFTIPNNLRNEISIKNKNSSNLIFAEQSDTFKNYLINVLNSISKNNFQKFNTEFLKNAKLLTFLRNNLK